MGTLLTVALLGGFLLLLARAVWAVLKQDGDEDAKAPEPTPREAAVADPPPGPLDDLMIAFLPTYIRPGHGFLVLRDRVMDRLELDGLDVGDPEAPHPDFGGSFRGYFNVPPGRHSLVAHWRDQSATWEVEVEPNRAYVKRMDWDAGGWVDDDPETEERYQKLALSGSMLEAKALRPWPRPSLYFLHPPSPLVVHERILAFDGPFGGLVNLPPGEIQVATPTHSAGCTLPLESMQLIDFDSGTPEFVDPKLGALLVRSHLRRAPREAVVSYEDFAARPKAEEALRAAQSALQAMQSALSGAPVRAFGDSDLESYERAFADYRDQGADALPAYIEALRAHYVVDSAMAEQAAYFGRYAALVEKHLELAPELAKTEALTYLRYLAEDLQDTGVAELDERGQALQKRLPAR